MSRAVEEWVGKTDDSRAPPRVELRVFVAAGGKCEHCGVKVMRRRDWQLDHRVALINGGENRERNLQVLCTPCHRPKTRADVAEKAKVDRVRKRHLGITKSRSPLPFGKGSRLKRKINGEVVER